MTATPLTLAQLTEGSLSGDGVFDVLMNATRAHLESEYAKNRIRGPEYSQVYLASMQAVLQQATAFLLTKDKAANEAAMVAAQIALLEQQRLNAIAEHDVLLAQKCKLDAEYDVLLEQKLKSAAENQLLVQKVITERAQVQAIGVDADSVIGKQKSLYQAQTDGFKRDAEQKAAKLMVDSWNIRRTTDEATVADQTNMLADSVVGRAVTKMLAGVGA